MSSLRKQRNQIPSLTSAQVLLSSEIRYLRITRPGCRYGLDHLPNLPTGILELTGHTLPSQDHNFAAPRKFPRELQEFPGRQQLSNFQTRAPNVPSFEILLQEALLGTSIDHGLSAGFNIRVDPCGNTAQRPYNGPSFLQPRYRGKRSRFKTAASCAL